MNVSKWISNNIYILCWLCSVAIGVGCVACSRTDSTVPTLARQEPIAVFAPANNELTLSVEKSQPGPLSVCSFNIKFLGHYLDRDHVSLAKVLSPFDVVVIQELVAPPVNGQYPDGTAYHSDPEAAIFTAAMQQLGFSYWLSEEDTASGDQIHEGGSPTASEWWITFYKPNRLTPARDLPNGFLANDRSNHPDFERVPYAFSFRTTDTTLDFVLISVHLQPSAGPKNRERRAHEIQSITTWISAHENPERDFIILGDTNIEDIKEYKSILPAQYRSLNELCFATNVNPNNGHPYDHVFYRPLFTSEIDTAYGMRIIDLVSTLEPYWIGPGQYPGKPFKQGPFERYASDHNPITFQLRTTGRDDD